ncbi:MAG: hypothetical protein QXX83_05225 [Thermofilum sp.]
MPPGELARRYPELQVYVDFLARFLPVPVDSVEVHAVPLEPRS